MGTFEYDLKEYAPLFSDKYKVEPLANEHLKLTCECTETKDGDKCDDDFCLNRATKIECAKDCGQKCRNRRLQNKDDSQGKIVVFITAGKGKGLRAIQPIKEGELIMEYLGEVLPYEDYMERKRTIYALDQHDYCCFLDDKLVIDSHRMGNKCKFSSACNYIRM